MRTGLLLLNRIGEIRNYEFTVAPRSHKKLKAIPVTGHGGI
jgi:hypothetical protein